MSENINGRLAPTRIRIRVPALVNFGLWILGDCKKAWCLCLTCLTLSAVMTAAARSDDRPPNVVMIVVDDLGWRDLGCFGSTFYETPRIDDWARQGTVFHSAYTTCPVCSPTRASIITGKYPQRLGVTDYCGAAQPENWRRATPLLPAPYREHLELAEVTIAERLRDAGYATLFAGKWHLGPEEYWPEHQGFQFNFGGTAAGGPYTGNKYFSPYNNPRLSDGPPGEHLPDRLASETAKFIAQHSQQPFFAYVCFYSVHTPLMARGDLQAKYEAKRSTLPNKSAEELWGREGERKVRRVQDHAVYAAMVEAVDQAVGKILDAVSGAGVADETLVILTSDNGGLSTSEGHPTSNLPLRAGKGWLYEGGIRVPLIVRLPQALRSEATPQQTDAVVSSIDFFPTILEACQITTDGDAQPTIDGRSFLSVLQGKTPTPRAIYWHYPHYGNQGGSPSAAVRDGDWKLIEWFENDHAELYNLVTDLGESQDLAPEQPERVQRMRSQLHHWQAEVGATFPRPNPPK